VIGKGMQTHADSKPLAGLCRRPLWRQGSNSPSRRGFRLRGCERAAAWPSRRYQQGPLEGLNFHGTSSKSASKTARNKNIKTEIAAGKPPQTSRGHWLRDPAQAKAKGKAL